MEKLIARVTARGGRAPLTPPADRAAGARRLGGQAGSPGAAGRRGAGGAARGDGLRRRAAAGRWRPTCPPSPPTGPLGLPFRRRPSSRTCGSSPSRARHRRAAGDRPQHRGPADLGAAHRRAPRERRKVSSSWAATTPASGSPSRCRSCWPRSWSKRVDDPVQGWLHRARSGSRRWSTRTATSTAASRSGSGARTAGGTPTARSASTPTATTATCGAPSTSHVQPRPERRDLRRAARLLRAGDPGGPRPGRPRALRRRHHLPQLLAADPLPVGLHGRAGPGRRRPQMMGTGRGDAELIRGVHGKVYTPSSPPSSTRPPATRPTGPTATTASRPSPSSSGRAARGGRLHPARRPDPADLGGEPAGRPGIHPHVLDKREAGALSGARRR